MQQHLVLSHFHVLYCRFPGKDYYQPARGLFRPVQELDVIENADNDDDDDFGEFTPADHEPTEQVISDDHMTEADGYCPSEDPEEDFFDHSDLAEAKEIPRQVFVALKSQRSLRSKTKFTEEEVR